MDRGALANNVAELLSLFPKSFAVYGTALGSLREGDIIAHDPDSDIGIFTEDFKWDYVIEAVKRGYTIEEVFGMRHYGMEIALWKNGVKTDLMIFYQDKKTGLRFNVLWDNGGRHGMSDTIVHEYEESLFEPVDGKLGEHTIRTLGEPYILAVYGKNWRTPVKEWDWKTDHLCKKTG